MTSNTLLSRLALLQALLLAVPPPAAAKIRSDWSRVQAVESGRWTVVLLYKNEAPPQNLKIKGRFESATTGSITLVLPDGQTHNVQKRAVRKILVGRPLAQRWPGWAAMAIAAVSIETAVQNIDPGADISFKQRLGYLPIVLPTGLVFLYGSRLQGIYNVPPKHRAKMQTGARQADQGGPR